MSVVTVTLMFVSSVAASAGELVTAVVVTIPVVRSAVARTLAGDPGLFASAGS
jgi:hypothetical protein